MLEELDELAPAEAAEELLERMLQYARFRGAGGWTRRARTRDGQAFLYRSAPLPPALRRVPVEIAERAYDPDVLGEALGGAAAHAAAARPAPHGDAARHGRPSGWRSCAACCAAARFSFDEAVEGADRVTVAVTLFALLELYKRGEATGSRTSRSGRSRCRRRRMSAARPGQLEALLFLVARARSRSTSWPTRVQAGEEAVQRGARRAAPTTLDGRGVVLREVAGGLALASHPDAEEAARRLLARPRTPALTPAQAETLAIVAYLQPVSRPEVARIRGVASESATAALVERGLIEEAGRSQFGAVLYRTTPLFLKLFGLRLARRAARRRAVGPEPGGRGRAARPPAARRRGARLAQRVLTRGELAAGGVDVAAAGEADGGAQRRAPRARP